MIQKIDNFLIWSHFLNSCLEYMTAEKLSQNLSKTIRLSLIMLDKFAQQSLINKKELKESKKIEQKKLRSNDKLKLTTSSENNRRIFKDKKFNYKIKTRS